MGDDASLCRCLRDHGRHDLPNLLGDRAHNLGLCSCHSLRCLLKDRQLLLRAGNYSERTVIVFDLT
jgi:hypothetical protein